MLRDLATLPEGARFQTESGRAGTLVRPGEFSCGVLWDKRVIKTPTGESVETAHHLDIAARTQVVQIAATETQADA